jgi:hypothetical protein
MLADRAARSFQAQRPGTSIAVDAQAACPARTEPVEIVRPERADVAQLEPQARIYAPDAVDISFAERARRAICCDGVSRLDGDRHFEGTRGCHEASDGGAALVIQTKGSEKERSPREMDRHEVGKSGQLVRQRLHSGRNEHGVREAALLRVPSRSTGRLRHGPGVRIDADGERRGIGSRCREDGTAVPGSEVDDGPAMSPGQSGQLADVDVDDAAAGHDAHGAQYAIR